MKKIILLLGLVTLFSCSNENNVYDEQVINIQIVEIPDEYKEKYTFSDLKVDVYLKLDDYFNEKNSFFSSNVDNEGKITISKNIQFGTRYYIDIYTEDRILSNWKPTDLNVDYSNTIVFGSGGNINNFFNQVSINDQRALVGEWTFVNYDGTPQNPIVTERSKLVINKDFSIKSYESYNGVDLTVNYDYNGLKYVSTLPSESDYPYNLINPDGLHLMYNKDTKILHFHDYAAEYPLYKK